MVQAARISIEHPWLYPVEAVALGEIHRQAPEQIPAAVLPALIYLMTVVAYAIRRDYLPTQFGQFSLGRWGRWIAGLAVGWLVLIIAILTIPQEFHTATTTSGILCLIGGTLYICVIRRRIERGDSGVHRPDALSIQNDNRSP